MADVRVTFNTTELNQILRGVNGPVYLMLRQKAAAVLRKAQIYVPTDTGNLKRSLAMEMGTDNGVPVARVGSRGPVSYALYVHEGTRAGKVIRPVRAKALRFNSGGRVVFAKRVTRGATRANPFLKKALDEVIR